MENDPNKPRSCWGINPWDHPQQRLWRVSCRSSKEQRLDQHSPGRGNWWGAPRQHPLSPPCEIPEMPPWHLSCFKGPVFNLKSPLPSSPIPGQSPMWLFPKSEALVMSSCHFPLGETFLKTLFSPKWFLDSWQSPELYLMQKLFSELFSSGNSRFVTISCVGFLAQVTSFFVCFCIFLLALVGFLFWSVPLGFESLWAWTMWLIWAVF